MYDIIVSIFGSEAAAVHSDVIFYVGGALICLFFVIVVDLIRDIFCGFFRG